MESDQSVESAPNAEVQDSAQRADSSSSIQLTSVLGAGLASIVISAVLCARFPDWDHKRVVFGFLSLSLALGLAWQGWSTGTLRRSLLATTVCVAVALVVWLFGFTVLFGCIGAAVLLGELQERWQKRQETK